MTLLPPSRSINLLAYSSTEIVAFPLPSTWRLGRSPGWGLNMFLCRLFGLAPWKCPARWAVRQLSVPAPAPLARITIPCWPLRLGRFRTSPDILCAKFDRLVYTTISPLSYLTCLVGLDVWVWSLKCTSPSTLYGDQDCRRHTASLAEPRLTATAETSRRVVCGLILLKY